MDPQNGLGPVELDVGGLVLLSSGFLDEFDQFFQNLAAGLDTFSKAVVESGIQVIVGFSD